MGYFLKMMMTKKEYNNKNNSVQYKRSMFYSLRKRCLSVAQILAFFSGVYSLMFAPSAFAVCPVCAVVVSAGVGFSRWLGIDDSITGLWIGGLSVSLIGWTINWFNKINFRFYGRKISIVFLYYALIFLPLIHFNFIGSPENKIFGFDKLIVGIFIGSFAFLFTNVWYFYLKKKNLNRAYFPLQKVVMPAGTLLILSLFFYFLTK